MLFQPISFLQVSVLLIETLELPNCLMLLALTEGYGSTSLFQRATEFVVQNFHAHSMTPDFLDMPVGVLEVCMGSDSLRVSSEEMAVRSSTGQSVIPLPQLYTTQLPRNQCVRLYHLHIGVISGDIGLLQPFAGLFPALRCRL
ncbi:kelch repeat and BTB domain-containing protein 3 [Oncorhynchus kisutch]|uniref:kelch repeat and BTB domain-containing protein 3 n=1 Tax=Oncorhynchus kisutch TaxID=8019 RepID=UPI0012DBEFD9|nr:kelch repeat and BTB domain-containing protein 3 [Oncorhynchus kisutch]